MELIVLFVIILQIFLFFKTYQSINDYRKSLIEIDKLSIAKVSCPKEAFQETDINKLKKIIFSHQEENNDTNSIFLSLIYHQERGKFINFQKIQDNINDYIICNQNNFLDFSLIENMVERNIKSIEEQISYSIKIPLYLGIFSVAFGITFFERDVQAFFIPALLGFFITILSSNFIYKNAKKDIYDKKNSFYNFIQIHLLPKMNQNIPTILNSFQQKFLDFNKEFGISVEKIYLAFIENTKAIEAQKAIFEAIGMEKFLSINKQNIKIIQQLQESSKHIRSLNKHLTNMDNFIINSQNLVNKTNDILDKTSHIEDIATIVKSTLQDNQQILQFLSSHLDHMQDYKTEVHHKIAENEQRITDLFQGLLEHIQETSNNIRKFTAEEYQAIKDTLSSDKEFFKQLNELTAIRELLTSYINNQNKNTGNNNT